MSGGGSPPSHTTSTVTQSTSNLPDYAKPYYTSLMSRGQEESLRPYETYEGQRLTGMSDATRSGLDASSSYAQSGTPALDAATGLAGGMAGQAAGMTGYQSGYAAGPYGYDSINVRQFDQGAADEYMSPYMDDVIERARQEVIKSTMEEEALRDANAAARGSFGGSRAEVANQIARGQAQERMMDLTVEGRQSAFENAQQQFERDRQAQFGADVQNLDADIQTQQLGEQSRQRQEELTQSGRQSNLAAIEQAQQGANQLANLQSQRDQMVLDRIKAQLGVGQTEEEYEQEQLDIAYQDFVNQRDAERQNLQFLSSLLQGVPISANQDVVSSTGAPQNNALGSLGPLSGIQALYGLGG